MTVSWWENEEFPQIYPEYENFPWPPVAPVAPVATFCRSGMVLHGRIWLMPWSHIVTLSPLCLTAAIMTVLSLSSLRPPPLFSVYRNIQKDIYSEIVYVMPSYNRMFCKIWTLYIWVGFPRTEICPDFCHFFEIFDRLLRPNGLS